MKFNKKRLESIADTFELRGAFRIYKKKYIRRPLSVGFGAGRFNAPNRQFKTIYFATDFSTAVQEGLIRDRFNGKQSRRIAAHTLRAIAMVKVRATRELVLLDLRDGRASRANLPTSIRHDTDYQLAQELALFVHGQMKHVDGILYRSRFDDQPCVALFERTVPCLERLANLALLRHPDLQVVLDTLDVSVFNWRGHDHLVGSGH